MASKSVQRFRNAREKLFHSQRGLCYYCAKPMKLVFGRKGTPSANQVTLDHIIPKAKGGPVSPTSNCVAACNRCNQERGTQDARLFMLKKQGMI